MCELSVKSVLGQLRLWAAGLGMASCVWVHAQTPAPADASKLSAEQMVEQLRAQPASAPRTRSFRNLVVEAAPASAVAAAAVAVPRPSLSMQIQFEFASAKISPTSMQSLDTLAQALASPTLSGSKFAVEGHTDGVGSAALNERLSQSRADAVRQYLVAQRIEGGRLVSLGKGSRELADASDLKAAINRRVRIVNLD